MDWRTGSLAFVLSVALAGCGTMLNVAEFERKPSSEFDIKAPGKHQGPREIYGGVAIDATIGMAWIESGDIVPCLLAWGVDLPLSAVGDTLTLPLTIPAAIERAVNEHYRLNDDPESAASAEELVAEPASSGGSE